MVRTQTSCRQDKTICHDNQNNSHEPFAEPTPLDRSRGHLVPTRWALATRSRGRTPMFGTYAKPGVSGIPHRPASASGYRLNQYLRHRAGARIQSKRFRRKKTLPQVHFFSTRHRKPRSAIDQTEERSPATTLPPPEGDIKVEDLPKRPSPRRDQSERVTPRCIKVPPRPRPSSHLPLTSSTKFEPEPLHFGVEQTRQADITRRLHHRSKPPK